MSGNNKPIVAYKGFDKDWSCRGFEFEVGKTYTHDGKISICNSGFHACECPLDIWSYYPPVDGNQAAQVELVGVSDENQGDSKRVGKSITIKAALTIAGLVSAQVEWCQKHADAKNIASGYSSTAASSGYSSKAASSGDYSKAACDTNGFACVAGVGGRVKGNEGSALSLGYVDDKKRNRIAVAYVGENGIKPNVYYVLNDRNEFEEA